MLITRQSVLTDKWNTLDLPVTAERVNHWLTSGELIQIVFPELTADQRQFLMSGVTQEEWDKAFGDQNKIDSRDLQKIAMTMGKTVVTIDEHGNIKEVK
jgi:hypothetical protein